MDVFDGWNRRAARALIAAGRDGAQVEVSDGVIGGTPQELQAGADTAGAVGTSSPLSVSQPTPATEAEALAIKPIERDFMLRLAGAVGKSPRHVTYLRPDAGWSTGPGGLATEVNQQEKFAVRFVRVIGVFWSRN